MKCLYKVPFSGFFIVSAESAEDAKSMSKDDPEVIYSEESNGDVETCPTVYPFRLMIGITFLLSQQTRRPIMRLIDADKVPPLSDLSGCAYEGSEYQAYKSGAEYGRGLDG